MFDRYARNLLLLIAILCLPSCAQVQKFGRPVADRRTLDSSGIQSNRVQDERRSSSISGTEIQARAVFHAVEGGPGDPSCSDSDLECERDIVLTVGDDATSETEPLSMDDIEQLALANNPTLAMAVAEIEKERGLWTQVGLSPNPTVGYVNSSTTTNGDSQNNGVLLQQTFITAGKLEKARAAESFGIRDGNWQLTAQQMRVANDVRLRSYDVLAAQQFVAIAEESEEIAEKSLTAARRLYRAQQVAETDVLRAEVQLDSAQLALQNARTANDAAWHQLTISMGCPQLASAPLLAKDKDLPEFGSLEDEWQRLMTQSPQLRSAETQIQIAQAELASAQANRVPDVTVQFVSDYNSVGKYATFNSLVALPMPVYNRNQGGIYNAAQEVQRSRKEVERVQLVLRDQLVSSLRDYTQAKNRVQHLQNEILPRLTKSLELVIAGYERQELSFLEVLSAQQAHSQTSIEHATALHDARRLAVQIEGLQLTGGLNPAVIGTAIQESSGSDSRLRAVQAELEKQQGAAVKNFAPAAVD